VSTHLQYAHAINMVSHVMIGLKDNHVTALYSDSVDEPIPRFSEKLTNIPYNKAKYAIYDVTHN